MEAHIFRVLRVRAEALAYAAPGPNITRSQSKDVWEALLKSIMRVLTLQKTAGCPHVNLTSAVHDELVHATWTQSGAHGLGDHLAGIDIADKLRDTLGRVCPLLQKDYRCGLWRERK